VSSVKSKLWILRPRWDLGLRALLPELRAMRGPHVRDDVLAGFGGAAAALPLALFLAIDTGIAPISALVALVVGGLVAALLGGVRVASGGPVLASAAALTALTSAHDGETLALACLLAGLVSLVFGVMGVGRLADLLPLGVTHGFVLGIGGTLALHALPHVGGDELHTNLGPLEALDHVGASIRHVSLPAFSMAIVAGVGTGLSLRFAPRFPAALFLLAALAGVAWILAPDLPSLGAVLEVPPVGVPPVPRRGIAAAVGLSLSIALLAPIETILSASAERERDPDHHADADQDLVASGVASLLLAFVGGVPAATSIARGELHRDARPKTRLSSVTSALTSGVAGVGLLALGPHLPVAAISGVTIAIAVRLLDPRPVIALFRASRREAGAALVTFVVIAFLGLETGLQAGLGVSLVVAAASVARARHALHLGKAGAPHQVTLTGSLTFLASPMLRELSRKLGALDVPSGVILDVRGVSFVDATGATRLVDLARRVMERGGAVALLGISVESKEAFLRADPQRLLEGRFAVSEKELDEIIGRKGAFQPRAQLLAGLERFRSDVRQHLTPLFDQLADGQSPHTLLITCVDSRIQPELLTGAHPGELFIVRCLGGLVSPLGDDNLPAEAAAVEYAVGVLGVRNVIVCGHSQCGAIKALKSNAAPPELEALNRWMSKADAASGDLHGHDDVDDAARAAIARQLDNLRSIPQVREREKSGELFLQAWFYDVAKADVLEWDEVRREYVLAGEESRARLSARPSAEPDIR
jgi:carbonic anhydrase